MIKKIDFATQRRIDDDLVEIVYDVELDMHLIS